jgi:WD40 repeat protein
MKDVTLTDVWAVALSADGQYLAGTTQNGHIKVWDLGANEEEIRDHETKGSFGTCIDLVSISNTLVIFPNTHTLGIVTRWPTHR